MSFILKKAKPDLSDVALKRAREFRVRISLCLLSGFMLGFSFPPSSLGVLACFGLVPLLIVLADIDEIGLSLRYSYVALFVFHLITLNWTGGYSHGKDGYMMLAGAVTMIVHPLFYFMPLIAYLFVRKHFGHRVSLIAFPFLWVGYEYTHSLSEWSFPWVTIGNSQSYDIAQMQFISSTGVYGLSLWILVINVLVFVLYSKLAQRVWQPLSRRSLSFVVVILLIYFLPKIHGALILSNAPPYADPISEGENRVTVGMIQSNIDPWAKWKQSGFQAIELYLDLTRSLVANSAQQRPDLVLWPETAVPYWILAPENRETLNYLRQKLDEIGVPVLTGLPHAIYYEDSTQAPPSAKRNKKTGQRYDVFNAAAFIQPGVEEIPWYGKMRMVPIAERVPYADAFYFLDFLRWGVGIGGWQIGPDSTIFEDEATESKFSAMICYESTYPDFVAAFVRKGAEFITIITIDSWWGRMSGAYQHQRFAIFRAVENRRWIARCAVGGISCYIDPYGRVYDKTELFTQTTLIRTIGRSDEPTFYAKHGDWLGVGCLFSGGLFVAAAVGQWFKNKKRMASWESSA